MLSETNKKFLCSGWTVWVPTAFSLHNQRTERQIGILNRAVMRKPNAGARLGVREADIGNHYLEVTYG